MIADQMKPVRREIENRISGFCREKSRELFRKTETGDIIGTFIADLSVKGKMIRGLLAVMMHDAFGGNNHAGAVSAAAAIELFHAGLLIHDDIMDNDTIRRGMKTIHTIFADAAEKSGIRTDRQKFGNDMAICAGDTAFFLSFELLSDVNSGSSGSASVLREVARELATVTLGQTMDVFHSATARPVSKDDILNCYVHKTAGYTFSLPMAVGAIVAGNTDYALHKKIRNLGRHLGIAYQLKDDELGIFGDSGDTGKPVGSDITDNKKTFYRALADQRLNTDKKQHLDRLYGKSPLTAPEIKVIRKAYTESGIRREVSRLMTAHIKKAIALLDDITLPGTYREYIAELADFIINRPA